VTSPGGWQIIGRTPIRLFDPQKNPPSFLEMGDRVKFYTITAEEM
jgi:inhibitor of KinA